MARVIVTTFKKILFVWDWYMVVTRVIGNSVARWQGESLAPGRTSSEDHSVTVEKVIISFGVIFKLWGIGMHDNKLYVLWFDHHLYVEIIGEARVMNKVCGLILWFILYKWQK